MGGHACSGHVSLLILLLLGSAAAQKGSTWKTLRGDPPAVIAKGGFSGLFPDSSDIAYQFAATNQDSALWCDVRLTKDGVGICLPDIKMDNCTTISDVFPKGKNTYRVNGVSTTGWFSVDYDSTQLNNTFLTRSILSRIQRYDGAFPIVSADRVLSAYRAPSVWLNVQHDSFYSQFNLSMRSYILSLSKQYTIDYISSPDVSFLNSLLGRVSNKTKLVFRFLDEGIVEPSTNQTYGSILKNLTSIKTFASGILVPKNYIWPVMADNYLKPFTLVVDDAHKAGLAIYAADFANDVLLSYNYSYDPLAEYLSFIDNSRFCVDGFLTDFPITASQAVGCFSNLDNTKIDHGVPLVISHNGASGDYPDCTDLAYQKAVADGAHVIDCAVQVTKDGIPICMSSIDLQDVSTVVTSQFASLAVVIEDIKPVAGVYTFNLTWEDITNNLKPMISNLWITYGLSRNPRNRNVGNFMRLSDFLAFAKAEEDLSGIMITVERASFMAEKLGFGVVDAVIKALDDSGYSKQSAQKVMIQSANSSTLVKFKEEAKYNLVYMIDKDIQDAAPSSVAVIKKFADAVSVSTMSIYPSTSHFLINQTSRLVNTLQSAGLPVYVHLLMNEFVSQPWDFFSDATAQITSFVQKGVDGGGVDGVITDFPGTAHRYKLNSCLNLGNHKPYYLRVPQRGGLLSTIDTSAQPPAKAPMPFLTDLDVIEPPLPPVSNTTAPAPSHSTSRIRTDVSILATLLMMCAYLLI